MTTTSAATLLLVGAFCFTLMPALNFAAEFENCADETAIGKYTKVEVSNCADSDASCVLKRNTNATASITFTSVEDISELEVVVHGTVSGMFLPFKVPNKNGCKDSGLKCPLTKNTMYRYSMTLEIREIFPKVPVVIQFELRSDYEEVLCVLIPVVIV